MAYVTEDYADFAVTTAKGIVKEETDRLEQEVKNDLVNLLDRWGYLLAGRINARMEEVGIPQVLAIEVEWDLQTMPVFKFSGATYVGEIDNE